MTPLESLADRRPPTQPGRPAWPTGLEWSMLAVALVLTVQYAWLLDDAFIYFRYVDNLLYAGRGLVYNEGESVEGYSSPLWMLVLIGVRAAGLDWWLAIRLLGALGCLAWWAVLVAVNRAASPPGAPGINLPLLLLAPNYAVLCYMTSGTEGPLVQVAAALFALVVLRPGWRIGQIAVGMTPLVRHELAAPLLLVGAWCWWRTRRPPWTLLRSAALLGGAWVLFRIWYYADLLPNTFYLKDDWMPRQGWRYLLDSVNSYGFHVVLGAAWVGLLALRRVRGGAAALHLPARIVMLLLAATVALYVVKIGGDPRHYRFLAFPVVLSIASTAGLPEHMWSYGGRRIPTGLVFAGGLVLALFVATLYPRQLARHPLLGPQPDVPYHRMVDLINDAADHRHNPSLARPPWGRMRRERRRHYERARTAPATVKVGARCVDLYDAPASRVVHSLGLTDPFLARTTMRAARPAHKPGLRRLAADLADILASQPNGPSRGMFRNAVETGRAPDWVRANLDTLEVIERKAYNDHAFLENLRLALTAPPRIDPERTP